MKRCLCTSFHTVIIDHNGHLATNLEGNNFTAPQLGDLVQTFAARGIIQTMQHPNGQLRMPAFPVRFDCAAPPVEPSPLLGEHTTEVFGDWLGVSAGDVEGLRDDGVV